MSTVELLRFHRSMVTDETRLDRFRQAIDVCVKAGDVVLDLGTGTGVLAIMAARAGARRVYAVEATEIAEVARKICRENGVEDRIVVIDELSTRTSPAELADVLITETIGNFGLDEGILGWVLDARRRLLTPDAVIVPSVIELYATPVEYPKVYAQDIDWPFARHGVDFRPMRSFAVNNIYRERVQPESFLAAPRCLGSIDMSTFQSTAFTGEAEFEIGRAGELHGVAGWFHARLCDGVTLGNEPGGDARSWAQVFMPVDRPIRVEPGERLRLRLACSGSGRVWRWRLSTGASQSDAIDKETGRQAYEHSTFHGAPAMASHLHRQSEDHQPVPNADGLIMLDLLGLMDGKRSLDELSRLAAARHPGRFSDAAEALEHLRALSADLGA